MNPSNYYNSKLATLTPGCRHTRLVSAALAGLRNGIEPDRIISDIHSHADYNDPLPNSEICDAIRKASEYFQLDSIQYPILRGKASPPTPTHHPSPGQKEFFERFRNMGEKWMNRHPEYHGRASEALRSLSKIPIPANSPREQAALMIEAICKDPDGFTFAASDMKTPRDADHVLKSSVLVRQIREGKIGIPGLITANQLSGEKSLRPSGYWSMGTKSEIKHLRYAVIEFDGTESRPLPLIDQAFFWIGILTSEDTPILPIRTLVYSGSKSIHATLQFYELENIPQRLRGYYADLIHCQPDSMTREQLWTAQWNVIKDILASSDNTLFHCDIACKDTTRMTRLAGHLRKDTGNRQALLYLSNA